MTLAFPTRKPCCQLEQWIFSPPLSRPEKEKEGQKTGTKDLNPTPYSATNGYEIKVRPSEKEKHR